MATSRKEPPNIRDRTIRMSPTPSKPRARSVPSSPDRKFASSPASSSPDAYRPSLSVAGRSASSFSSMASSSTHGKSPSASPAVKPAHARVKADRPAAAPSPSSRDITRAPKSIPAVRKSKPVSPRPSAEAAVAPSPKPGVQKPTPGALRGGRTQLAAPSSARMAGAAAKRRPAAANGGAPAISRTRSVPARPTQASGMLFSKVQEEELDMELDEMESINTPSIEDQLQEQLPDLVELKPVGLAAFEGGRHEAAMVEEANDEVNVGENGNHEAEFMKSADEGERIEKEEAEAKAEKIEPVVVQGWRMDDPRSNEVIEETRSKLMEERKSKVKALVGAFETVMSFNKKKKEAEGDDT